MVKDPNVML
ncbi:Protein of unknown function [Lactobacillus helveticus CIRM-BIA 101]|nr:Protein of unknown function [Lactobacillus helveticus CIRM-BIA 101]